MNKRSPEWLSTHRGSKRGRPEISGARNWAGRDKKLLYLCAVPRHLPGATLAFAHGPLALALQAEHFSEGRCSMPGLGPLSRGHVGRRRPCWPGFRACSQSEAQADLGATGPRKRRKADLTHPGGADHVQYTLLRGGRAPSILVKKYPRRLTASLCGAPRPPWGHALMSPESPRATPGAPTPIPDSLPGSSGELWFH